MWRAHHILARMNSVGRFSWEGYLCKKKIYTLEKIQDYFSAEKLRTVLLPIITKDGGLSLRALDWLVTNYAKKFPVIYNIKPPNCPEVIVNIYRSYKSWLWNHKRKNFDPFRRGKRIYFHMDTPTTAEPCGIKPVMYESTVGQLNFFFWASRYGVLDYAQFNIKSIEKDQATSTKLPVESSKLPVESTKLPVECCAVPVSPVGCLGTPASQLGTMLTKKKKRRQLSRAPRESVFIYPTNIKVVFNPSAPVAQVIPSS